MTSTVTVKCVICGHTETIPLTADEPFCTKCYGPVSVRQVDVTHESEVVNATAFTPPKIDE